MYSYMFKRKKKELVQCRCFNGEKRTLGEKEERKQKTLKGAQYLEKI